MVELPLNDCALPQSTPPLNPHGVQLALNHQEWDLIQKSNDHPLHSQVTRWPISHLLGLITCRLENEWNDELTSSGDLVYLGALPKEMTTIINHYCMESLVKCQRREDRQHLKQLCAAIKTKWKEILRFLCLKPMAMQRVISAQLGEYKKHLQGKQREDIIRKAKLEAMLQPSPPDNEILDTPSYSTSLGQSITRTCIGTGCALTKHYKQFRVYSNATNANDKKCPQRKTFKAALNKVLQIEDYLVE